MPKETFTDEELLLQIQEGSSSAFAELVKRHNKKFYELSYKYLLCQHEAEDVVQNAFLKLWERPDIWNKGKDAKFTTWFYRIVINMCLDRKKKKKPLSINENFKIKDEQDNQEIIAQKNERLLELKTQIASLPKRQKTALILCIYEELSHSDAAKVMKISEKALQSLLMRAKTTLKKNMTKYLRA